MQGGSARGTRGAGGLYPQYLATISILANIVRPSVYHRLYDTAFGVGTFSWQDPVHSWKAGPGEVMTVEKSFI